jgi:hypothetical protein
MAKARRLSDDSLDYLDTARLITGQDFPSNFSALFMVFFMLLNIIDANVDAALLQFNVDENISFKPSLYTNDVTLKANVGLTINYNFRGIDYSYYTLKFL